MAAASGGWAGKEKTTVSEAKLATVVGEIRRLTNSSCATGTRNLPLYVSLHANLATLYIYMFYHIYVNSNVAQLYILSYIIH